MSKANVGGRYLAASLMIAGVAVIAIGFAARHVISGGVRPYAHIAVLAIGAMIAISGVLLWKDS